MSRTHTIWAVSLLALALTAPARAAETFTDARGDNGEAHDITAVAVSNDTTQVVVSFPAKPLAEPHATRRPEVAAADRHRP